MTAFVLEGLDGANPLGFLAALGTLRVSSAAWPDSRAPVRMGWVLGGLGPRPRLVVPAIDADADARSVFLDGLERVLRGLRGHKAIEFDNNLNLNVRVDVFRERLVEAAAEATPADRVYADFSAAFGSEVARDNGIIEDTALRTMSGAGHQHFLGSIRELVDSTTRAHLEAALFEPWSYSDERPSMRWDPADDRRYALRADDPSTSPIRTSRGANRLAVEGLPLLPVVPLSGRAATCGFRISGRRVEWTWPIWEPAVELDVVRSMLSLGELQSDRPDRARLRAMGIVEIYRCERVTQGKFRNFTPAWSV